MAQYSYETSVRNNGRQLVLEPLETRVLPSSTPAPPYPAGPYPAPLAVGDFNGDTGPAGAARRRRASTACVPSGSLRDSGRRFEWPGTTAGFDSLRSRDLGNDLRAAVTDKRRGSRRGRGRPCR